MENNKFNPKQFLKAKTLSPLELKKIKGGAEIVLEDVVVTSINKKK